MAKNTTNNKTTTSAKRTISTPKPAAETPTKRPYNRKPKAPSIPETPTADSIPNPDLGVKIIGKEPNDYFKEAAKGRESLVLEKAAKEVTNEIQAEDKDLLNQSDKEPSLDMPEEKGHFEVVDMEEEFEMELMQTGRFLTYSKYLQLSKDKINPVIYDANKYNTIPSKLTFIYYDMMSKMIKASASISKGPLMIPSCRMDTVITEIPPSDKFVSIANMARYIQCKLERDSWYIGLSKIDCMVLTNKGSLLLYSINDKGDFTNGYSPINSVTANFGVEIITPAIVNGSIVAHDRYTTKVQYKVDDSFENSNFNKVAIKDLGEIIGSFEDTNNNNSRYLVSEKILAYWTRDYADRLYPLDIINKTLEDTVYPIIFSSKCFIER